MKVLVVEDDIYHREVLGLRLHGLGCEAIAASSEAEALQLAFLEPIDFAVVDLKLGPDAEAGVRIVQALRAHPATRKLPIIIHSIFVSRPSDLPVGLPDDVSYLAKPFKLQQLVDLIASYRGDREPAEAELS